MDGKVAAVRLVSAFARDAGLELDADNRWVRQAVIVPWAELETGCESGKCPNFRMLLAASLIQTQYQCTDEETALMVQESPYLQLFCGMPRYDGLRPPFCAEQMREFHDGLGEDELRRIGDIIRRGAGA